MVTTVALPNLTRDQAVERAAFVTVESYHIKLDLTDRTGKTGEHTYHSVTTVEFDALAGADTYIDIAAQSINSATLNGREIDVSDYDESAGIPLTGLAEHNVVVVDADCVYSKTGEGLHRFVDPVDSEVYLYSQFETADAKRVFACFDQPDLKATFDITVTAPPHWQVVSNGATVDVRRRRRAHFRHHAADEHIPGRACGRPVLRVWRDTYTDEHGESRWASSAGARWPNTWTPSGCSPRPSRDSASTTSLRGAATRSASTTSCSCPEFNAGAMENAGAVTFREDYVFRAGSPDLLRTALPRPCCTRWRTCGSATW